MANLIVENTLFGLVQRIGDQSAFHLQNLLNKYCAIMEEPRITPATVNDMKLLMGGEDTLEVSVKHGDSEKLERTPVIVTTNTDLGKWVPMADADPLKSRTKTFVLDKCIKQTGDSDRKVASQQVAPPFKLCQRMLYHCAEQYHCSVRHVNI